MKKMQLITYSPVVYNSFDKNIEVNDFNNLKSLDNYEINIFDLTNPGIWKNANNKSRTPESNYFAYLSDFISIKTMISNSNKSKIIVCLPNNVSYKCSIYKEIVSYQLKDVISTFTEIINRLLPFIGYSFTYENTETSIDSTIFNAAFYFNKGVFDELTLSDNSEKVTSIKHKNIIMTSLDILGERNIDCINKFLRATGIIQCKEQYPEWLYMYNFNDDEIQKNNIEQAKAQIKLQKDIIEQANKKIEENMHFKSMLYTNSDELVTVVFEVLEYIFDVSLKEFIDEKHEDFLFKKDGITYIGEIKGVTTNIRSEHISQLDVHYYSYLDRLQEEGKVETIKKILVINYERNRDVSERNDVHESQIDLARRNETIIFDTQNLLMIYEKLINGTLTKESVIEYIKNNSGIVDINKIKN